MLVAEIMQPKVVRIKPDTRVRDALQTMMAHQLDSVPVVDDRNQVVGILTYADLLYRARRQHPRAVEMFLYTVGFLEDDTDFLERFEEMLDEQVASVCTHPVVTCNPMDSTVTVVGLMADYRIKLLPVTSDHGTLLGLLWRDDLMRAIWGPSDGEE